MHRVHVHTHSSLSYEATSTDEYTISRRQACWCCEGFIIRFSLFGVMLLSWSKRRLDNRNQIQLYKTIRQLMRERRRVGDLQTAAPRFYRRYLIFFIQSQHNGATMPRTIIKCIAIFPFFFLHENGKVRRLI